MRRALAVLLAGLIAGCGDDQPADPPAGVQVADLTLDSQAVGRAMDVKVVVPEDGAERRSLLVFLHGRSGDEGSYLHEPLFDALEALGDRAPVVAFREGARRQVPAAPPSTPWPGGHDGDYWDAHRDDSMRIHARALRRC